MTGFSKLTLDASLVIAVTFFGTAIAATILPWWKKDLYQKSPIVRYAIGGLPIISIAGAITTVFLGWVHLRVAVELPLRDRHQQHPVDPVPRGDLRDRRGRLRRRPRRPPPAGRRPRRDPRGDPGRVTARDPRDESARTPSGRSSFRTRRRDPRHRRGVSAERRRFRSRAPGMRGSMARSQRIQGVGSGTDPHRGLRANGSRAPSVRAGKRWLRANPRRRSREELRRAGRPDRRLA